MCSKLVANLCYDDCFIYVVADLPARTSMQAAGFCIQWKTPMRIITTISPLEVSLNCANRAFTYFSTVLEQLSPTLVLTSSKADELFMDMIRDHSELSWYSFGTLISGTIVENIEGQFQVRPWKEFTPTRGLVRLKELPLLSNPVSHESDDREDTRASEPANAYEFMRQRQTSHPALTRWTAGVKLGNFTGDANKSPFCVCVTTVF